MRAWEAEGDKEEDLAKFWKSRTSSRPDLSGCVVEDGEEVENRRHGRRKLNTPNVRERTDCAIRKMAKVLRTVITSKFSRPMCSNNLLRYLLIKSVVGRKWWEIKNMLNGARMYPNMRSEGWVFNIKIKNKIKKYMRNAYLTTDAKEPCMAS